jgi:hypothetical protein
VLLAAGIGGIANFADPATRLVGLTSAGVVTVIGLGLLARRRWRSGTTPTRTMPTPAR